MDKDREIIEVWCQNMINNIQKSPIFWFYYYEIIFAELCWLIKRKDFYNAHKLIKNWPFRQLIISIVAEIQERLERHNRIWKRTQT